MPYTEIPDDLRGLSNEELEHRAAELNQAVSEWSDRSGDTREYNRLIAKASSANALVEQIQAARRQYARGVGIERAFGPGWGGNLISRSDPSIDIAPGDVLRMPADQARSKALRCVEARGRNLASSQQDDMDRLIRAAVTADDPNVDGSYVARRTLITESDAYRSGWMRVVTDPVPLLSAEEIGALRSLKELDRTEFRAMGDYSNPAGGYGIPVFIDPSIIQSAQGSMAPIRNLARTETVTTTVWRGVSSAGVTWAFQTEGAITTDNSPVLAQPTVSVHMARGFIPFSIEVQSDYPNFAAEMSALLAAGYDELLADKLMQGSGTGEPAGLVTRLDGTPASEILITSAGTLGGVDIDRSWEALPDKFKGRSSWLTSYGVADQIAALSTLNAGSIAYQTVDLTGVVQTVRTRPLYPTSYGLTSKLSGASHQNVAIVGDFSNYLIASRAGMSVELVPMLFSQQTAGVGVGFPTGQRGWFAYGRTGGDVLVPGAFRLLNQT